MFLQCASASVVVSSQHSVLLSDTLRWKEFPFSYMPRGFSPFRVLPHKQCQLVPLVILFPAIQLP